MKSQANFVLQWCWAPLLFVRALPWDFLVFLWDPLLTIVEEKDVRLKESSAMIRQLEASTLSRLDWERLRGATTLDLTPQFFEGHGIVNTG